MDRDDIIRMAREAGICIGDSILLPAPAGQVEALERFAALVQVEYAALRKDVPVIAFLKDDSQ